MVNNHYCRKITCLVALGLVAVLLLCACGGKSGQTGDKKYIAEGDGWYITQDGTLYVSGKNPMPTLDIDAFDDSAWALYKSQIKAVVVEDGVTYINSASFAFIEYLESVSLPDSVTVIGQSAFSDCMRLKTIKIPENVEKIEFNAFLCCRGLTELEIPASVETIEFGAFAACDMVQKVTLHEGLKTIGENAFGFTTLKTLVLPEGLVSIDDGGLYNCRDLEELTIPKSLETVGVNIFPPSLKKVYYGGTKTQWKELAGTYFVSDQAIVEIVCSDGTITMQFSETEKSSAE